MVDLSASHGQSFRFHSLLSTTNYTLSIPSSYNHAMTPSAKVKLLKQHIFNVTKSITYINPTTKRTIHYWDVVSNAVSFLGIPFAPFLTPLSRALFP